MSIFSKLFSRRNVVTVLVERDTEKVSAMDSFLEINLVDINVFPSDEDVVLLLGGSYLESYQRGKSFDTAFDTYIRFDTIKLAGEDSAEVIEVARKLQALHDLRALQGKIYEATLFNVIFLDSEHELSLSLDKELALLRVKGVHCTYKRNASQFGKTTYEYIKFTGKDEDVVNEEALKVKDLHLQRILKARERALATIAELNL